MSTGIQTRRRWHFSLKSLLLAAPLVSAALGYVCIFVEWNVDEATLARQIDPILTQHETTLAVQRGEIIWLSLNQIPPSDAGNERLHELGITHFYSSVGLQGTRSVRDADLTLLLDRMPKLRVLDVRNTETTAAVLPRIARLNDLEWLWLDAAHGTDKSLKKSPCDAQSTLAFAGGQKRIRDEHQEAPRGVARLPDRRQAVTGTIRSHPPTRGGHCFGR